MIELDLQRFRVLVQRLSSNLKAYGGFLQRMASRGKTGLVSWKKYGDWLQPGRVPSSDLIGQMSSSFNFGLTLKILRDTAWILDGNNSSQFQNYSRAFFAVQEAFHRQYFNGKTYGDGTQAALVYALYLGAPPSSSIDKEAFNQLVTAIYQVVGLSEICLTYM